MTIKIMQCVSSYSPNIIGGAEISAQILAESLVKSENDVVVITQSRDNKHFNNVNGVRIHYLKQFNFYSFYKSFSAAALLKPFWHLMDMFNFVMAIRVFNVLRKEKPHVLFTHTIAGFSCAVWLAAKVLRIPIIHFLHDYYLLCPKGSMFKKSERCKKACLTCTIFSYPKKIMTNLVDGVCSNSDFVLQRHKEYGMFNNKASIISFNPILNETNIDTLPNKKPNGTITFGYVGRISPEKGIDLLIDTIKHLENARLFIFGKDENSSYSAKIKKVDNSCAKIFFKGFCATSQIYPQIDVLIVPSLWEEPFGRIIPEAYTYGIPVIGAQRGGITELIDNNKTGILFDPDQPETLMKAMSVFCDYPEMCTKMRAAAQASGKKFESSVIVNTIRDFAYKVMDYKES